ncbi:MAG TPA: hypothetical protein VN174_01395 [Candidatus Methanoperedens sp.]|nr:hypothetical protein [Candidatus Methanoperedens sp.]
MDTNTLPENDLHEEKVLYEWEAAERAYQKKDKDFWVTAVAILILVSVILIFIKEFFLIMSLISVLFLFYALSSVPPGTIKNKLTNRGLYFGELKYEWKDLKKFWFKKSMSSDTINFATDLRFPRLITLVVNPKDINHLKEIVVKKIPMLETSPTFVDRLTKWFADRLPLEDREGTKKGN